MRQKDHVFDSLIRDRSRQQSQVFGMFSRQDSVKQVAAPSWPRNRD
jgi:hypothetical protein